MRSVVAHLKTAAQHFVAVMSVCSSASPWHDYISAITFAAGGVLSLTSTDAVFARFLRIATRRDVLRRS